MGKALMTEDLVNSGEARPAGAVFSPTRWSVVMEARSTAVGRGPALEKLCSTYWLPIYSYLRRRGHAAQDAEDLTQGFFAYLLESDFLDRPDPTKGRFRGYLIGALKHFLGSHFEKENAQKRGGKATFLDWDNLDAEREFSALEQTQQDPSEAYETGWALALFGAALRRLEDEQAAAGKKDQFLALKRYLSSAPTRGDYDRTAVELGLSRTHVAVAVHRLNNRYREIIKLEIASTVQDPADVKQEMLHLLKALQH
jgi:RNA polymerase sigma factor (sigma-70 family)